MLAGVFGGLWGGECGHDMAEPSELLPTMFIVRLGLVGREGGRES